MKALRFTSFMIAVALLSPAAHAKSKQDNQHSPRPQDQIIVEGHIPVPQGLVTGFVVTRHYNRRYVYAQRAAGQTPMLIDITRLDTPKVVSMLSAAGGEGSGNLAAVAGTAVVASDTAPALAPPHPQTIRIIDYSNAEQPKITREFAGVTAISNQNGVILLANPDGIWILSEKPAEDPAMEAEYARRVLYQ